MLLAEGGGIGDVFDVSWPARVNGNEIIGLCLIFILSFSSRNLSFSLSFSSLTLSFSRFFSSFSRLLSLSLAWLSPLDELFLDGVPLKNCKTRLLLGVWGIPAGNGGDGNGDGTALPLETEVAVEGRVIAELDIWRLSAGIDGTGAVGMLEWDVETEVATEILPAPVDCEVDVESECLCINAGGGEGYETGGAGLE
jgi:hypothetical protein